MNKLLVHFVARGGRQAELVQQLPELAKSWCERLRGENLRATVLVARSDDPMRRTGLGDPTRAFDATLELELTARDAGAQFENGLLGLGSRLGDQIYCDMSAIQLGTNRVFVQSEPTPVRFQYCMRRRHDFSHTEYLRRYEKIHSSFGLETKGIAGYAQFHIDLAAAQRACKAAGFGVSSVDSVSELHLESLEAFLAAGEHNAKLGAQQDEEEFVDRLNSVMWVSDEVFRIGH